MELAIFPIAAIFLLLSSAGAPARLTIGPGSTAAQICRLFTPSCTARMEPATQKRARQSGSSRTCWNHPGPACREDARPARSLPVSGDGIDPAPRYRNRFGVASAAFLSTAPPVA